MTSSKKIPLTRQNIPKILVDWTSGIIAVIIIIGVPYLVYTHVYHALNPNNNNFWERLTAGIIALVVAATAGLITIILVYAALKLVHEKMVESGVYEDDGLT